MFKKFFDKVKEKAKELVGVKTKPEKVAKPAPEKKSPS